MSWGSSRLETWPDPGLKRRQHSCHQGRRRSGNTAASHTGWQHASWDWHEGWGSDTWGSGWHSSAASGSGDNWTLRPQPPRPPSPRWRPRTGDSSAKCGPVAAETAVDMVEIEVEVALPATDRELPRPPAAGGGDEGLGGTNGSDGFAVIRTQR